MTWLKVSELNPNDYNPNRVFTPELTLLKISMLSCGWTQPVVITPEKNIVDGFHRWHLAKFDKDVNEMTGGWVPVVTLRDRSKEELMMDTVRHNRARGLHGVLAMGIIVKALMDAGYTRDFIAEQLQMEGEEVDRLATSKTVVENQGKDSFGKGWVPLPKDRNKA